MRRTQIYLTDEQRRGLRKAARRRGTSVAEVIRRAVDSFLRRDDVDTTDVLQRTLGALPDLEVPDRSEWDRGFG